MEELEGAATGIAAGESLPANWELATDVLAYLERAGVRHEEDEEETVFPRLAHLPALRPLLKTLRAEHRSQRKLVAQLADLVSAQAESGTARKLSRLAAKLQTSYQAHITREDAELLPAMKRYLDADSEAEMAAEMAARRS